jgi:hypothetical protein
MKRTRLFSLIEGYLEGTTSPAERQELADAVTADPDLRERFIAQILLARRLRAALRPRAEGSTWAKISSLTTPQGPARRQRLADRVDAALDRRAASRRTGRVAWVAAGVTAAAAIAFLVARPDRDRSDPMATLAPQPAREPAVLPPAPIEALPPRAAPGPTVGENRPTVAPLPLPLPPPPPSAPEPVPLEPRAALAAEMLAAGEPALAARGDVLQYVGFDVPRPLRAIRGRLRPRFTQLATGLTGTGLRVYFHRDQVGLPGGGARVFIAASALTAAADTPPARDELHLRYHVRLSETFDFAGGGVLPGVCLGGCAGVIRPRWNAFGELLFDPIAGRRPAEGRWQGGLLARGTWHSIELRVKLNTPGAADGAVEGWLDGVRAVSLAGLRLRDTESTGLSGVWFHTMYRGPAGRAPARDGDATFDNLAVGTGYLGPAPPDEKNRVTNPAPVDPGERR